MFFETVDRAVAITEGNEGFPSGHQRQPRVVYTLGEWEERRSGSSSRSHDASLPRRPSTLLTGKGSGTQPNSQSIMTRRTELLSSAYSGSSPAAEMALRGRNQSRRLFLPRFSKREQPRLRQTQPSSTLLEFDSTGPPARETSCRLKQRKSSISRNSVSPVPTTAVTRCAARRRRRRSRWHL